MNENKTPRWFVYGAYTVAGRPKLEQAVMRHATAKYMHTLIVDLDQVVDYLKKYQDEIWEQNRRWKLVRIYYGVNSMVNGNAFIHIGEQGLRLQQVREEVESI